MNMFCNCMRQMDQGPEPYAADIMDMAVQNQNFRTAIWTGCHAQMTLMSILPCEDIGLEVHPDTDQILWIVEGNAITKMGARRNQVDFEQRVQAGDVVFVPAGTWHNIINTGRRDLKIASIYAPPNHPRGTVHRTKEDAERQGD